MRTNIVIPCYNEANRLDAEQFVRFARNHAQVQLLFVNDGSSDATCELLDRLVQQVPQNLSALHLPKNQGKAEAVRQGVLQALSSGCEAVGYWDADLATPLADIDSFCAVLKRRPEIQLVVGTRLPLLGRDIRRHPLRRLLGRTFATVASVALGLPIVDTQCGAKLFRANPATAELFSEPFQSRWIFDVELLARWINRCQGSTTVRQQIFEYPLEAWEDVPGSKLKPRHFLQAFHEMASLYLRYLRPLVSRWQPTPLAHPSAGKTTHDSSSRRAA